MSKSHGKAETSATKKHRVVIGKAMREQDAHAMAKQHPQQSAGAVPPAEYGAHSHSMAAHLHSGGEEHTKPEGNLRHGAEPSALREPPMVMQRVGKQHRG